MLEMLTFFHSIIRSDSDPVFFPAKVGSVTLIKSHLIQKKREQMDDFFIFFQVDDVTVDSFNRDSTKIYNVQVRVEYLPNTYIIHVYIYIRIYVYTIDIYAYIVQVRIKYLLQRTVIHFI